MPSIFFKDYIVRNELYLHLGWSGGQAWINLEKFSFLVIAHRSNRALAEDCLLYKWISASDIIFGAVWHWQEYKTKSSILLYLYANLLTLSYYLLQQSSLWFFYLIQQDSITNLPWSWLQSRPAILKGLFSLPIAMIDSWSLTSTFLC